MPVERLKHLARGKQIDKSVDSARGPHRQRRTHVCMYFVHVHRTASSTARTLDPGPAWGWGQVRGVCGGMALEEPRHLIMSEV